jgi:hypothetical protein
MLGTKTAPIVGGARTAMLAVAVFPVPPFVEVTALLVVLCEPATAPVTVAVTVQLPLAGMVAPLRVKVARVPLHVVDPESKVSPAGSESLNPTPVS